MAPDKGRKPKVDDELLDWFTVSYKTIYIGGAVLVALLVGGGWMYYVRHTTIVPPPPETPPPNATTAHFTSIEGSVKVKAVGTFEWVTADKAIILKRSDLVRTGPGAAAEIEFFDGTIVHVRPDSLITIEETSEDPSTKQRKVAWHISSGEVQFNTARKNVPGSSIEASTPTVRTIAGDESKGGIRVAETGDTDVKIYRGTGVVETKTGQKSELASGQGLKVDSSGLAGPKVTLPDVPKLLAPSHQTEITYPDPTRATTLFAWKEVPTSSTYHFQIDYSPYFNRPLYDRKGWKGTSIELRGLEPAKYYWRVAAAGQDDAEGAFSDFARFTVIRPNAAQGDGPPPPLQIESIDVRSNLLQIKGRTEAGATVTVNGQRVEVQGDGGFNEFITLDKPGKQVVTVRAVGLNGGVNEQKRPVVVAAF